MIEVMLQTMSATKVEVAGVAHIVIGTRATLVSRPNNALVAIIACGTMNSILDSLAIVLLDGGWEHLMEMMIQRVVVLGVLLGHARMAKVEVFAVGALIAKATDTVAAVITLNSRMGKTLADRCGLGFCGWDLRARRLLWLRGTGRLRRRLRG
jgi:hypothetical protein